MKKQIIIIVLLLTLTGILPVMASHVPESEPDALAHLGQPALAEAADSATATARAALLQEFPLIHNDSIEQSVSYLFQLGLQHAKQGDMAGAYLYWQDCLQIDSCHAPSWFYLAPLYQHRQQKDSLFICLEKAYQLEPRNKAYLLNLANIYMQDQRMPEAAELLEEYVQYYPQEYEFYYSVAEIYSRAKMPEQALRVLKDLEKIVGKNEDISLNIYNNYRMMGKNKKAIKEMEALLAVDPENIRFQLYHAFAYEEYKPEKALQLYREIIARGQSQGEAELLMADFLLRLDRKTEAEAIYQQLFNEKKGTYANKIEVIQAYYLKEHLEDTVLIPKLFDQLLAEYPDEISGHVLYAAWLREFHQPMKSAIHYRQAIELNPQKKELWMDYLGLFIQLNNHDMIEHISQEAISYFPQEFIFAYYLAVVHSIKGDLPQALEDYRHCLSILEPQQAGQLSQVYSAMGDIYHQQALMDSSYFCYDEALKYNPNNVLVLNNYAYFLSLEERDLDKAEKMARQAVSLEGNNATYLDTYAWVCFKKGNYTMAKIYIERALLSDKAPSAEVVEHYGDILWFCDEKDKAVEQWKQAAGLSEEVSEILQQKINQASYVE